MANITEKKGYELGIPYAITFAPNDKYQRFRQKDRWYKCFQTTREIFMMIDEATRNDEGPGLRYELYQEISEPLQMRDGKAGRIHYHGIIIINNYHVWRSLLTYWISQLTVHGIIDLDTIESMDTWYEYCTKQQHKSNFHSITNETPSIMKTLCDEGPAEG